MAKRGWAEHLGQDDPDHDAVDRGHGRWLRFAQRHEHPPRVRRVRGRADRDCSSAAASTLGRARHAAVRARDRAAADRQGSRHRHPAARPEHGRAATPRTARTARRTTASSSRTSSISNQNVIAHCLEGSAARLQAPSNHEPVAPALGQITVDTLAEGARDRGRRTPTQKATRSSSSTSRAAVRATASSRTRCSSASPPTAAGAHRRRAADRRARATSCSATTSRRVDVVHAATRRAEGRRRRRRPRSTPAPSVRCSR